MCTRDDDCAPLECGPNGACQIVDDVAHLSPEIEAMLTSTTDYSFSAPTSIDTSTGEIIPAPPTGVVVLADVSQEVGDGSVMVIQAYTINITADVKVTGSRPLIIVGDAISASAMIDVSADGPVQGPGGYPPGIGPGAGGGGMVGDGLEDSGGGGGAHGSEGGPGGSAFDATRGTGGAIYGSSLVLEGGSGGGAGSPAACQISGGGGGGVIQLSARTSITLNGGVDSIQVLNATGGGGTHGGNCGGGNGGSGAGGGAGGMIVLQAPSLLGQVGFGARGGGGGAGAGVDGSTVGLDGADEGGGGGASANAGSGGFAECSANGGPGDTVGGAGQNAGGGAGGTGRVYFLTSGPAPGYEVCPTPG